MTRTCFKFRSGPVIGNIHGSSIPKRLGCRSSLTAKMISVGDSSIPNDGMSIASDSLVILRIQPKRWVLFVETGTSWSTFSGTSRSCSSSSLLSKVRPNGSGGMSSLGVSSFSRKGWRKAREFVSSELREKEISHSGQLERPSWHHRVEARLVDVNGGLDALQPNVWGL